MNFEKETELRNKYSLIGRGIMALRNSLEGLTQLKATGDPFFDENEEARQQLLLLVTKASHRALQQEIGALVAEYGPDARRVLE